MSTATLTPAMEQYHRFKRQHPDAILFFRMGDFYEMFYDDAREASRLLGLTLTSRSHGRTAGEVPLAGVPHHAMEGYLARLIQLGRKVAVCEQMEDPRLAKGVVKRDVVQVVSPGTALSDAMLDGSRNNFLVSLHRDTRRVGLAMVDLSTGDFGVNEVDPTELGDELAALAPAELLLADDADAAWVAELRQWVPAAAISRLDAHDFALAAAHPLLLDQLRVQSLKGFGCEDLEAAIRAAGAAVRYLRDNQRGALDHLNHLTRRTRADHLVLNSAAQRHLELLANLQDGGRANTLLEVIDQTRTAMGARLLRQWLVAPLRDLGPIEQRLEAVAELASSAALRQRVRSGLAAVGDLERLMARICCQRATPRDLVGLARSLAAAGPIREALTGASAALLVDARERGLPDVTELVERITATLVDDPPLSTGDGGLIRAGCSAEVDALRQDSSGGKEFIASLQARERERTGITSLKIGFNQVFGYYLEISKANLERVPDDYHRKQTLVNAERFITPELKQYEERVLGAEDRLKQLESALFLELRSWTGQWTAPVQQSARALAQLDVLSGLAEVAVAGDWVRPEVNDSTRLYLREARHPVVERQLRQGAFVPNDVELDGEAQQIALITGPNMAGKSTIIRQAGLLVVLAQMGSFVPAATASVGLVDQVFTRVGASDNLARGESTFMVEMNEAANILNNATGRSLILMDELGRGTSTFDGMSIAWAIVEYLHHGDPPRPRTLFATHYHELTELGQLLPRVRNLNVLVREEGDHVVFLHRLAEGPCDRSYGIHVARMAGMPAAVVNRAYEILQRLEQGHVARERLSAAPPPTAQLDLFAPPSPVQAVATALGDLDVDRLTPLEALLKLHEWKASLRE